MMEVLESIASRLSEKYNYLNDTNMSTFTVINDGHTIRINRQTIDIVRLTNYYAIFLE